MRHPALQFLALGALLFAAARLFGTDAPAMAMQPPARIAVAEIETLRRGFLAERGRPPEPAELEALAQARADEEVLFREALALGLDETDSVVQSRLLGNMRFLAAAGAPGDDASLLQQALAVGMQRSDPVIRRRLANVMRLRLAARAEPPTEEELSRAYAQHAEELREPPRVWLTQRYLGPARALPLPTELAGRTEALLARSFGPEFARAVLALPPGQWSAPLRSVHGLHRVLVTARKQGEVPPLSAVRPRLRDAFRAEREARAVAEALVDLRRRHPVQIERPEPLPAVPQARATGGPRQQRGADPS